jgi:curved DNA-binding protein CbpA
MCCRMVDHEIFQLRDAVITSEGENATFYSFVGVPPSASIDQINKAYRKMNAKIHPDKARQSFVANYGRPKPGEVKAKGAVVHKKPSHREIERFYKQAEERYAKLSVVVNILRGENRARYDYFLKKGFPAWKGTGYYYSRYRPGLGAVLIGLFVVMGGAAHYGALYIGFKRHREFVERYISHARTMAWGDNFSGIAGIPGGLNGSAAAASSGADKDESEEGQAQQWNRKQKRQKEREDRKAGKNPKAVKSVKERGISTPVEAELTSGPVGNKKRVVAQNGKVLIVDSVGNVYVEEQSEEGETLELLLDVCFSYPLPSHHRFPSIVLSRPTDRRNPTTQNN